MLGFADSHGTIPAHQLGTSKSPCTGPGHLAVVQHFDIAFNMRRSIGQLVVAVLVVEFLVVAGVVLLLFFSSAIRAPNQPLEFLVVAPEISLLNRWEISLHPPARNADEPRAARGDLAASATPNR